MNVLDLVRSICEEPMMAEIVIVESPTCRFAYPVTAVCRLDEDDGTVKMVLIADTQPSETLKHDDAADLRKEIGNGSDTVDAGSGIFRWIRRCLPDDEKAKADRDLS